MIPDTSRQSLLYACERLYGDRLVSLAIFGSWTRGTASPASDIDLLVVAEPLPPSRGKRVAEFGPADLETIPARRSIWPDNATTVSLSPVFKTRTEVLAGSPLFLDMTLERDILFDRDHFLASYLDGLTDRMRHLGSRRRVVEGNYYWEYKPDLRPHEVVEL